MESNKHYQDAESVIEAIKNGTLPKDFSDWEMRDSDGIPVAFEGAEAGLLPDSFDNWSLGGGGTTVAHIAAGEGTLPANFSQWDIKNSRGDPVAMIAARSPKASLEHFNDWELSNGRTTVAHVAAAHGKLPKGFDKWGLLSKNGDTVAHIAAYNGHLPADFKQWDLKERENGHTVAHTAATKNGLPENFDQWELRDNDGATVAHFAARFAGRMPSEGQLYLADNNGWTVAHDAALTGVLPKDFNGWEVANNSGVSVAHAAADEGRLPENFNKWDLRDSRGDSVAHYAARKLSLPLGFDEWDLKNKGFSPSGTKKGSEQTVREWFGQSMITSKMYDRRDVYSHSEVAQSKVKNSLTPFLEKDRIDSFSTAQRYMIADKIKSEMSNNNIPDVKGIIADVSKNKKKIDKEFYSEKSNLRISGSRKDLSLAVAMYLRNELPEDFNNWDINWKGLTLAHHAARDGRLPDKFDQWDLKGSGRHSSDTSVINYYMFCNRNSGEAKGQLPDDYIRWFNEKYKQSPIVAFENVGYLPPGFSDWDRRMPTGVANDYENKTIAHLAAGAGLLPSDFDKWGMADKDGNTVAHVAARAHCLPPDFDKWGMADKDGNTVAHEAARARCLPPDFDKWGMADKDGNTVAHVAASACARRLHSPSNVLPKELEHWHAKNSDGETVIDVARKYGGGSLIEETYASALANGMASSIHGAAPAPALSYKEAAQALRDGTLSADFNDWGKKNEAGWTLAHAAASIGKLPADFKDWGMEGAQPGLTVAHIAMRQGTLPASFNDWGIKDASGKTLGEVAVKHPKLGAEYRERIEASKQAQQPKTEARAPEPQAAKPSSEAQAQGGKTNQAAPIETSSTGRITGGGRFSRPPDLSNREPEPERRPIKAFISRGM